MKKSILLLINGFGIERKDSVEIYNSNLMPNLDALSKKYVFGSLSSIVNDYNNGYRLFSISQEKTIEMDIVDRAIEDKSINSNPAMVKLQNTITANNKLHVFYTLDIGKRFLQVKELLRLINPLKNKNVFLHIILTSSSINDYSNIDRVMGKLAFELGEYCKLGIIVGKNKVASDNLIRTIIKEYGEHWGEYAKKIEILKRDVVAPHDADPFYVNRGFQLAKDDNVLFLNYKSFDLSSVIESFTSNGIIPFSLYEMPNCIGLFKKDDQEVECFLNSLKRVNSKVLLLTDKEKINDINYYLNGMQTGICPNITYAVRNMALLKNKESLTNIINNEQYNGIILDFNVSNTTKLGELKDRLKEIDEIIKSLEEITQELNINFIISSLFGMHAILMDGAVQKTVNFSGRVPCIIVNKDYSKANYSIADKDIYELSLAFLSSISDTTLGSGILHKKSFLEKILKK